MLFYYHEIKYIYHLNGSVFLATAVQQSEKELARKIGQGEVVKLVWSLEVLFQCCKQVFFKTRVLTILSMQKLGKQIKQHRDDSFFFFNRGQTILHIIVQCVFQGIQNL